MYTDASVNNKQGEKDMKVDTSKAPSWAHSYGELNGGYYWLNDTHRQDFRHKVTRKRCNPFNTSVTNVTRFKREPSFFDNAPDWAHSHGFLDGRDVWFDSHSWVSVLGDIDAIKPIAIFGTNFLELVEHVTHFKPESMPPVTVEDFEDFEHMKLNAAVATLEQLGYTYKGEPLWKPPTPEDTVFIRRNTPSTSVEFLQSCIDVQAERGKQYDPKGDKERSFATVASMFNEVRSTELKGSDICLILEFVKLVRQYADPSRVHDDSLLDKVSYSSLWAEELKREHE